MRKTSGTSSGRKRGPNATWEKALRACADADRARRFIEHLRRTEAAPALKRADAAAAGVLAAVLGGSQALAELLLAHPDWVGPLIEPGYLDHPRQPAGLRREAERCLEPFQPGDPSVDALARLGDFKQREMLRIAARDLAGLGSVPQIIGELSALADVCLEIIYRRVRQQMIQRFGTPYHQEPDGPWRATGFCVIALGKLGGQELNYSSDIDLMFVYTDEGRVSRETPGKAGPPIRGLNNHQFFTRLVEGMVAELTRPTPAGPLFRVDLRLRPEGDAGPLVRSLAGYENFYAQWGQTWERLMLIKARPASGDAELGSEFLDLIQPFRYPRSLAPGVLREIAVMRQRIEFEVVKPGEMGRNIKLGRGGIREIEFIVQTLQMLHGGRTPFLQGHQTLSALQKLVDYHLLSPSDAAQLGEAYRFLRAAEHRLQMEANRQTHVLPAGPEALERLAALMGFASPPAFQTELDRHRGHVRAVYEQLLAVEKPPPAPRWPQDFERYESIWKQILAEHGFQEPDSALRRISEFVQGPGFGHTSPRTVERAFELVDRFLGFCPSPERVAALAAPNPPLLLSDPDRVIVRLDSFVAAYGARSVLYELWVANPSLFRLLIFLFDRSEFLAELAIRTPDLVDDLELSGRLRRRKTAQQTLDELRHGLEDQDQMTWIRRYHQAELMRLGLRDILGLADFEQNLVELSALADACLEYALEVVMRRHRLRHPPFAIIGLGKLGGCELTYGSDLDVVLVAPAGARGLTRHQQWAAEAFELLSAPTEAGIAFATDARLRPDGEKGLLVQPLDACEKYYGRRAALWEIQALTRARAVAGDRQTGERFVALASRFGDFRPGHPGCGLAAYTPAWRSEIGRMRQRIERERTPAGHEQLAFKTAAGGLVDAEFIAQMLCLAGGWHEPNTLAALARGRAEGALPPLEAGRLIESYRHLRRIEGILRRWSFASEILLPDSRAPLRRVALRCGFPDADSFLGAVSSWRATIRAVYRTTPP